MGQLNKYHLKAVKSKMLRNTIFFPFTNSASRAFSHSQNRCHFWKCRIAEHQKKKSASFKNTVVLSSYLLLENMCVLNANYLSVQHLLWRTKTFWYSCRAQAKWCRRRATSTLDSCACYFVSFFLTLWVLNESGGTFWNMIRSLCVCMCLRLPLLVLEGGVKLANPGLFWSQHCHLLILWLWEIDFTF